MKWITLYLLVSACTTRDTKVTSDKPQTSEQTTVVSETPLPVFSNKIVIDFEKESFRKLPPSWSQHFNGEGSTRWEVTDENGSHVLAQLQSNNPSKHFNLAVLDTFTVKNLSLSVKLKAISGNKDQGGGLIWRYQNENNYYVVRANPLEDNVVLYKVEDGARTDLPLVDKGKTYGVKAPKLGKGWNSLKLVAQDDLFTVYLNGSELFKVKDSTFLQAGKTGCWTKADAVTWFDDFTIEY